MYIDEIIPPIFRAGKKPNYNLTVILNQEEVDIITEALQKKIDRITSAHTKICDVLTLIPTDKLLEATEELKQIIVFLRFMQSKLVQGKTLVLSYEVAVIILDAVEEFYMLVSTNHSAPISALRDNFRFLILGEKVEILTNISNT